MDTKPQPAALELTPRPRTNQTRLPVWFFKKSYLNIQQSLSQLADDKPLTLLNQHLNVAATLTTYGDQLKIAATTGKVRISRQEQCELLQQLKQNYACPELFSANQARHLGILLGMLHQFRGPYYRTLLIALEQYPMYNILTRTVDNHLNLEIEEFVDILLSQLKFSVESFLASHFEDVLCHEVFLHAEQYEATQPEVDAFLNFVCSYFALRAIRLPLDLKLNHKFEKLINAEFRVGTLTELDQIDIKKLLARSHALCFHIFYQANFDSDLLKKLSHLQHRLRGFCKKIKRHQTPLTPAKNAYCCTQLRNAYPLLSEDAGTEDELQELDDYQDNLSNCQHLAWRYQNVEHKAKSV